MDAVTNFALRHRWWVFLVWAAMLVTGGALASRTIDSLAYDFSLPGQPGYETSAQILDTYGNGGDTPPLIPVVTVPPDTTVAKQQAKVDAIFTAIEREVPGVRVVDFARTGDKHFLGEDGRTAYALVFTPPSHGLGPALQQELPPVLARQAAASGFSIGLTGYSMLAAGTGATEPDVLTETVIAAVGALLVLAFVFGSFLALVPVTVAAVSILSTFLVVLLLTTFTDVSFVVQFLISLVGLGVAIDYSLLVVSRWREERAHGRDNEDAVREAMLTAGRAVLSSGTTVAISLMALIAIPVPFMRSMGYGGLLIPLVSTAVVLTLLPALLASVGPRVDWPRLRQEKVASRAWTAWTGAVVRYRWAAAIIAVGILAAFIVPLFGVKIGAARTDSLATGGETYQALQTIRDGGAPAGVVTPIEVLVRGGDPEAVARAAREVDGVATAFAPDGPAWRRDGMSIVDVIPTEETVDSAASDIVRRITDATSSQPGVVGAAGQGAVVLDYIKAVYGNFPIALLLIVVITCIQLMRTFRSLLLPLKAVLLNLISVSATFGVIVLFWQYGYGSDLVFGIEPTGAITFWVPLVIFAFLFGLSMDYEVFILARMREEYDASGSTEAAIVTGMGRTGRLVTSAALILFLAFAALTSAPGTDVKVLATALGVGILLDATVVRALLVPAMVSLFGRWNWWMPVWLARLLRLDPESDSRLPRGTAGRHRRPSRQPASGALAATLQLARGGN
jgi:putative drug exporter of the RND superfamily